MKSALATIVGLLFDDWWLGVGIGASLLIAKLSLLAGMNPQLGGLLLFVLLAGSLVLSLIMEYRRKLKASG